MRWFTIILLALPLCCAEQHHAQYRRQALHPLNRKHHTCKAISSLDAAFREGCNWCTCVKGRVQCSDSICSSSDLESLSGTNECRGRIQWYDQCNECLCNAEVGHRGCTKLGCPDNPERRRRSSGFLILPDDPRLSAAKCQAGSQDAWWRVGCIYCRCAGGVILCSREECRSGAPSAVQAECKGQIQWEKDECNTCRCSGGTAVCTEKICGPAPPTSAPLIPPTSSRPECLEGTTKRRGCNDCICVNGRLVCTRRVCAPAPHPDHLTVCDLPTHLDKSEGCRALIPRWTYQVGSQDCVRTIYTGCGGSENLFEDLNTCRLVCGVRNSTHALPNSGIIPVTPECAEGSIIKEDCNTCVCTGGRLRCTRRFCANALPETADICRHPPIYNPLLICHAHFTMWTYISEMKVCRQIKFQGCSETKNVYPDLETCQKTCQHMGLREETEAGTLRDQRCLRRPMDGACPRELEPRYLFDPQIGRCLRTYTSTCGAMNDSFATLQECQFTCAE